MSFLLHRNDKKQKMNTRLKICGMKHNTLDVANLLPDYLGFIFWEPSSRFFDGKMPNIPENIKKVGVFVDTDLEEIISIVKKYNLDAVQLHGKESADFCAKLGTLRFSKPKGSPSLKIIKVFSIKDKFDFSILKTYENVCDYFLFDTKGKLPGGNGYTFDWEVLKNYPSTKPYFLSGGIDLEDVDKIKDFLSKPEAKYCYALDVNSGFEIKPGLKDIDKLNQFKNSTQQTT